MPTRERFGSISFSNSNRLPKISLPASAASPVTFPPGRARLATSPVPTGSTLLDHDDRDGRGRLHGRNRDRIDPPVTMMSTPSRTRSAASAGSRSMLAVGEAVLDDDILANAVAEAPQALFERFNDNGAFAPGDAIDEVSDPVDPPCRLLRARGQRPRRRRATE